MADNSPQSLTRRPRIDVLKFGKTPLYLVFLCIGLLVAVLIYSIHVSTDKSDRNRSSQTPPAPAHDPKPLAQKQERLLGLANAEPAAEKKDEEEASEQGKRLVNVIHEIKPDPEYQARKKELEVLRKMRAQSLQKALSAPMRVSIPAHTRARAETRQKDTAGASLQARHPTPNMAAMTMPPQQGEPGERVEKEKFLNSRARHDGKWTLKQQRTAGHAFELKTGTVIPAIMLTGINSDLPGHLIAQVSRTVFDTALGEYLLIPQGSRLFGLYDSRVAMGQKRLLVAWNRILFPDGSSITLGAMPGADMAGLAGFQGEVDNHYLRIFGSAAIMSLISGGMAYGVDALDNDTDNDSPSLRDSLGSALSSQMGQSSLGLLQRNMQIKPELTIGPGYRFNVVVTKDIVFGKPYKPWR